MKKRIIKKHIEKFFQYKGQSIIKNSAYSTGLKYKVVLFYCPLEGVELYFKTVKQAFRYLDKIDFSKIIKNDIPF